MFAATLAVNAASCTGAQGEVPTRFVAFDEADAAWLESELAHWVSERERELCAARARDEALQLDASAPGEVSIEFTFKGAHHVRTVARGADSPELFRYQLAATAEELVRSTWEAPPPPRFTVLARGELQPLAVGPIAFGGSAGVGLFVIPSLCLELTGGGASFSATALPGGGVVTGTLARGTLSTSWLPVRVGVFRAGVRASLQAGALWTSVREVPAAATTAVTPWLAAAAGLTVGIETRRVMVQLFGELGAVLAGTTVSSEGVPVHRVTGLLGTAGLQVGWLW